MLLDLGTFFFSENLQQTRNELLQSGRSPKPTLPGGSNIVTLKYMCNNAKDNCAGACD